MKTLGFVDVCGQDWRVVECTGEEMEAQGHPNAVGLCSDGECQIYLLDACRKDRKDTFFHEYMHAVLRSSGALYGLLTSAGVPFLGDKSDTIEETFIRVLTPHLLKAFGPPKIKKCPSSTKTS